MKTNKQGNTPTVKTPTVKTVNVKLPESKEPDRKKFNGDMSYAPQVLDEILRIRPKHILEFGAGQCTPELRKICRVTSVDDDPNYKPTMLLPNVKGFFDLSGTPLPSGVDLVIVDGPSILKGGARERMVDYLDKFPKEAVYIVDDTHRAGELKLAQLLGAWKGKSVRFVKTNLKEFAIIE